MTPGRNGVRISHWPSTRSRWPAPAPTWTPCAWCRRTTTSPPLVRWLLGRGTGPSTSSGATTLSRCTAALRTGTRTPRFAAQGRRAGLHPAGRRIRHAGARLSSTATESRPARARATVRGAAAAHDSAASEARADRLPLKIAARHRWLVRHLRQPHHVATAARRVAWMGFHPPRITFEGTVRAVSGQIGPGGPKTGIWNEFRPLRPARCRPVDAAFPWLPSFRSRTRPTAIHKHAAAGAHAQGRALLRIGVGTGQDCGHQVRNFLRQLRARGRVDPRFDGKSSHKRPQFLPESRR